MSKIDLKVTGVKGGNPSYSDNKGRVVIYVDSSNVSEDRYIAVDAFEGWGATYHRREESEIEICYGSTTHTFKNFLEFVKTLNAGVNSIEEYNKKTKRKKL